MGKTVRSLIVVAATLHSLAASAGTIWCQGKITNTYVDAGGSLFIQGVWRNDYTMLCSIKSVWKGIDPVVCMGWMGIALTATSKQQEVIVYYADPTAVACNTLPTYSNAPGPIYLMLKVP
jgi:hypothetical protein